MLSQKIQIRGWVCQTHAGMTVLSLFDGMSCGRIALRELGAEVETYYASEIDPHAIRQTLHNFPDTVQLGDVERWREWAIDWAGIDLLLAGSPCQGFSFAGKQLAFDDPRSRLFFVFAEILDYARSRNPRVKFLLENVNMKKDYLRIISERVGVFPVRINSALVSAQNRDRWYWTDIRTRREGLFGELYSDIPQPADRGLCLRDVLDDKVPEKYNIGEKLMRYITDPKRLGKYTELNDGSGKASCLAAKTNASWTGTFLYCGENTRIGGVSVSERGVRFFQNDAKRSTLSEYGTAVFDNQKTDAITTCHPPKVIVQDRQVIQLNPGKESQQNRVYDPAGKSPALLAGMSCGSNAVAQSGTIRRLTPTECARLQTIPDWYEWVVSNTQIYKMLGNGWTVEVIKHILSFWEEQNQKQL